MLYVASVLVDWGNTVDNVIYRTLLLMVMLAVLIKKENIMDKIIEFKRRRQQKA